MKTQTDFTGTLVSVDTLNEYNTRESTIKSGQYGVRCIFRACTENAESGGALGFMSEHTSGQLYALMLNFDRSKFTSIEAVEKAVHENLDAQKVPLSVVETTLDEPVTLSNGRTYTRHYYVAFNPTRADLSSAAAAAVEKFKSVAVSA